MSPGWLGSVLDPSKSGQTSQEPFSQSIAHENVRRTLSGNDQSSKIDPVHRWSRFLGSWTPLVVLILSAAPLQLSATGAKLADLNGLAFSFEENL